MRFASLFPRSRADIDRLAARCAAADRVVGDRVATAARAEEWHLAEPDSREAFAALEAAEELLFLAEYEQREARAALQRAAARPRFQRQAEDRPRGTRPSP